MTPDIRDSAQKVIDAGDDRQAYLQARSEFIKAMADYERLLAREVGES